MKEQLLDQMKLVYEIMLDPELVEAITTMTWNLYIALKEKGFTDDQAMEIVGRYSQPNK